MLGVIDVLTELLKSFEINLLLAKLKRYFHE